MTDHKIVCQSLHNKPLSKLFLSIWKKQFEQNYVNHWYIKLYIDQILRCIKQCYRQSCGWHLFYENRESKRLVRLVLEKRN